MAPLPLIPDTSLLPAPFLPISSRQLEGTS
jgi:hypothetical protein